MTRSTQSGVTLVELMVAVLISGIALAGIFGFMSTSSALFRSQHKVAETQHVARVGTTIIAQDLHHAGYGSTAHCNRDPRVMDPADSCDPWNVGPGNRALFFVDQAAHNYGPAAGDNPQYRPDELWIMTNPYPGQLLAATTINGSDVIFTQDQAGAETLYNLILSADVVRINNRGVLSFRQGGNYTAGGGIGSTWTLTVNPPPAAGVGDYARGYAAADIRVNAVAWFRYYLKAVSSSGDIKLDLVREVWPSPLAAGPTQTAIVAEYVVDVQFSFCMDQNYDPTTPPMPPNAVCSIEDPTVINANPEQVRAVTMTIRTRSETEDKEAFGDPAFPLTWYDLDSNPQNGVARVRTVSRTVNVANLGL